MLYANRPAKAVQRRMVVDACRRLTAVAPTSDYQYIGFGGIEFNDFVDVHNALGITRMTSIERQDGIKDRIEFNKPYASISLEIGEARDVLPNLDWSQLGIVWLDYTDPLTQDILRDIDFVTRAATPGTMLVTTVQADLGPVPGRLAAISENLGPKLPATVTAQTVTGWGVAEVQREVMQTTASSVAREAHHGTFRQCFNFHYADNAKMLTWGGVVSAPNVDRAIDQCRFDDLSYVSLGSKALRIRVPDLTVREWDYYERNVAGAAKLPKPTPGTSREDLDAFVSVYRWSA